MKVRALGPSFALLEALGLIHWCEGISSGTVATLLLELPAPARAGGVHRSRASRQQPLPEAERGSSSQ